MHERLDVALRLRRQRFVLSLAKRNGLEIPEPVRNSSGLQVRNRRRPPLRSDVVPQVGEVAERGRILDRLRSRKPDALACNFYEPLFSDEPLD